MVLLDICAAVNEDIHCTAAELVYDTTLRLLGEFFYASPSDIHTEYLWRTVHTDTVLYFTLASVLAILAAMPHRVYLSLYFPVFVM